MKIDSLQGHRGTRPSVRRPEQRRRLTLEHLENRQLLTVDLVLNGNDAGVGSLRATIAAAAPGDTISFQPGVTGVDLTSGEIDINIPLTFIGNNVPINSTAGALVIEPGGDGFSALGLNLTGCGGTALVFNDSTGSVQGSYFQDNPGGGVSVSGPDANVNCSGNNFFFNGGASLANNGGTLTANYDQFVGNTNDSGSVVSFTGGTESVGNALFAVNYTSTVLSSSGGSILDLESSTFDSNTATTVLSSNGSTDTLNNTVFENNTANDILDIEGGVLSSYNVNLSNNTATQEILLGGGSNTQFVNASVYGIQGSGIEVTGNLAQVFLAQSSFQYLDSPGGQTSGAAIWVDPNATETSVVLQENTFGIMHGGAFLDQGNDSADLVMGNTFAGSLGGAAVSIAPPAGSYGGNLNLQNNVFTDNVGDGVASGVEIVSGSFTNDLIQFNTFNGGSNGYDVSAFLGSQGGGYLSLAQNYHLNGDGALAVYGPTVGAFGPPTQVTFAASEVTGNNNPLGQVYFTGGGQQDVIGNVYIHDNQGPGVNVQGGSGSSVLVAGSTIATNTIGIEATSGYTQGFGFNSPAGAIDSLTVANTTLYDNQNGGILATFLPVPFSGAPQGRGLPGVNLVSVTDVNNAGGALIVNGAIPPQFGYNPPGGFGFPGSPNFGSFMFAGPPFSGYNPPGGLGVPGSANIDSSILAGSNGPDITSSNAPVGAQYSTIGNADGVNFTNAGNASFLTNTIGTTAHPVNPGLIGPVTQTPVQYFGAGVQGGAVGPVFLVASSSTAFQSGDPELVNDPFPFTTGLDQNGNPLSSTPDQGALQQSPPNGPGYSGLSHALGSVQPASTLVLQGGGATLPAGRPSSSVATAIPGGPLALMPIPSKQLSLPNQLLGN